MKAYVNGSMLDEDKAVISVFNRGYLYGDSLFETMRSYGGIIFRFVGHMDRLYSSMKFLKIRQRLSRKEAEDAAYNLLKINGLKDASIRMTVSRGVSVHKGFSISQSGASDVVITAAPFVPRPAKYYDEGIKADISRFRKNSFAFSGGFKTPDYLDSIIARSEAAAKGSFETIFLNESGRVCEASVSNIFMVKGNRLMTPALDCGVLPGVTRKTVLELAPYAGLGTEEGRFDEDELKTSEEVFITNSLIELIPVVSVDGARIGDGKPGKVTLRLRKLYDESVKKETGGV